MNAVEIESAVSELIAQPFDASEFPFQFLAAYDNKNTTLAKLRSGSTNKSDVEGGVLQRKNIHLLVTEPGKVSAGLISLKLSPATLKHQCRFVLATDGDQLEAEDMVSGESIACEYAEFPDHFGFFLSLAGIETVRAIRENSFDIRAIGRLNRLYVELLRVNPEWKEGELRHEMNKFLVRLIFCFYAEDTGVFGDRLFTNTIEMMTDRESTNTHEVIGEIFSWMNVNDKERAFRENVPAWVKPFEYVNGGLFSGSVKIPRFSKTARSYLVQIGSLDWKQINPDIFGSMIQGVANDDERSNLGMHYTSVPNILKVLNPLFLDGLRSDLAQAGTNKKKLIALRDRLAHIRVFDPACGSGNFLLVAYKQLRGIEHEINEKLGEPDRYTDIPITNFRGIELQDFAAEVARLSLVIAEFQCNSLYLGQTLAISGFLPLSKKNWIVCGNSLRLDWTEISPPQGRIVQLVADDLFSTPLEQTAIDFENAGGEIYICGNPPFAGKKTQSEEQKQDLNELLGREISRWRSLDYVSGWFYKVADYLGQCDQNAAAALVSTNSICQGDSIDILWSNLLNRVGISFAYKSFLWSNLAKNKAAVSCVIVGLKRDPGNNRLLFDQDKDGRTTAKTVSNINAYLEEGSTVIVKRSRTPLSADLPRMQFGNMPVDNKEEHYLMLSPKQLQELNLPYELQKKIVRRLYGSDEFISGNVLYCLWIEDEHLEEARSVPEIARRIDECRKFREGLEDESTRKLAARPHQFREMHCGRHHTIVVPSVSSERREYLPCGLLGSDSVISNLAFALYDAPLWNLALIASRLHLVWVKGVCGKMKTDFRYSNSLGWHTFPVPKLTTKNKEDLTRAAERILEVRERHFPATIADLYDRSSMPEDLREAHRWNDEVVERIFIGRKFKNDSERLAKLYDLYARLTSANQKEQAS